MEQLPSTRKAIIYHGKTVALDSLSLLLEQGFVLKYKLEKVHWDFGLIFVVITGLTDIGNRQEQRLFRDNTIFWRINGRYFIKIHVLRQFSTNLYHHQKRSYFWTITLILQMILNTVFCVQNYTCDVSSIYYINFVLKLYLQHKNTLIKL